MASAYSTLADGGELRPPFIVSKVTDAKGNVLYEHQVKGDKVLDDKVAEEVNYTLNQVVEGGTATGAKISQPAAGKTGTTENYRDAWFVGYTCKLTAAVWLGYPDLDANGQTRYMKSVHGKSVTGGSFPATIWRKYMEKATVGLDSCPFPKPSLAPYTGTNDTLITGPTTSSTSTPPSSAPVTTTTGPPVSTTTTTRPTTTTTTKPTSTTTTAPKP